MDNLTRAQSESRVHGFTLVELLMVMVIIVILVAIAAPILSQSFKHSRVRSATNTAVTALYRGRAEAQRLGSNVGVFFGDDTTRLNPKPLPGILPPYGSIATWVVRPHKPVSSFVSFGASRSEVDDMLSSADYGRPYYPDDPNGNPPVWYPFHFKVVPLTQQALTFESGVRIFSGSYYINRNGSLRDFMFYHYQKSEVGEIKRHHVVFSRNGTISAGAPGLHWFHAVLVYDVETGEHLLIHTGRWYSGMRPRILSTTLTHFMGAPLTNQRTLDQLVSDHPGDN